MNKKEFMQKAWDYWHRDLDEDIMPEKPNQSFEVGFQAGIEYSNQKTSDVK